MKTIEKNIKKLKVLQSKLEKSGLILTENTDEKKFKVTISAEVLGKPVDSKQYKIKMRTKKHPITIDTCILGAKFKITATHESWESILKKIPFNESSFHSQFSQSFIDNALIPIMYKTDQFKKENQPRGIQSKDSVVFYNQVKREAALLYCYSKLWFQINERERQDILKEAENIFKKTQTDNQDLMAAMTYCKVIDILSKEEIKLLNPVAITFHIMDKLYKGKRNNTGWWNWNEKEFQRHYLTPHNNPHIDFYQNGKTALKDSNSVISILKRFLSLP